MLKYRLHQRKSTTENCTGFPARSFQSILRKSNAASSAVNAPTVPTSRDHIDALSSKRSQENERRKRDRETGRRTQLPRNMKTTDTVLSRIVPGRLRSGMQATNTSTYRHSHPIICSCQNEGTGGGSSPAMEKTLSQGGGVDSRV